MALLPSILLVPRLFVVVAFGRIATLIFAVLLDTALETRPGVFFVAIFIFDAAT